jgi:glycosyltransferase involved in cell wall biosynthesis
MPSEPSVHLVDILIPTYNYGRFIGDCLASVAAQTFKNFRVFVQDNASTDDTAAIVRSWQDRIDLVYECNETNLGAERNHVILFAKSQAKYRIVLHADDQWQPEFLEQTVAALEENPRCILAYTDWTMIAEEGAQAIDQELPFRGDGSGIHHDAAALLWHNYITPSFSLYRTEAYHTLPACLGLELRCDHLTAFHAAAVGGQYFVDQRLGLYRRHGTSESDRLFASGRDMDELYVFYSRIYANFEYDAPLRLLAKICETAKLLGTGPCQAFARLKDESSPLSCRIREQRRDIVPLVARVALAWPMLAAERRQALDLLRDLGWEQPGAVPEDLVAKVRSDRSQPAEELRPPVERALREVDGEHFARRMHGQWRVRPRFIFPVDPSQATAAREALTGQLYDDWRIAEHPDALSAAGLDDWVVLMPPGTRLAPEALFSLADAINLKPQWQMIYTDDATAWCTPRFKPDFDPVLLASSDYLGVIAVSGTVFAAVASPTSVASELPYVLAWQIAGTLGEAVIGHLSKCLFLLPEGYSGATRELRHTCVDAHFARLGRSVSWPESAWLRIAIPGEPPPVTMIVPGGSERDLEALAAGTDYPTLTRLDCAATPAALSAALAAVADDLTLVVLPGLQPADPQWLRLLVETLVGWNASAVGAAIVREQALVDAGLVLGIGGSIGPMLPGARFGTADDPLGRAALPHQVSALSGQCLLLSTAALAAIGDLDTDYVSLAGCLADACLRLQGTGHRLLWTPAAVLEQTAPPPVQPLEAPDRFVDRYLGQLANDPYWNRNLSLTNGNSDVETDLVPRWEPTRRDALRVLALPMPPSGQAEYRVTAPMRMLDELGLAQVTLACEPHPGRARAPTPVELERLAPDVLYAQAAFDDIRLKGLVAAARYKPSLLRVFSLDDRVSDIPDYNASNKALPQAAVVERMKLALKSCQRLVVSTPPLAELYRHDVDDIRIVPNRLERTLWQTASVPRHRVGGKPRVGWAGALQHEGDLAIIAPVIEALASEVDWIFFGMIPAGCEKYVAEFYPPVKPYAAYPAKLGSLALDLALAPLEINLFNEAKSNLRLLEYGFFGWPVIASDIVPYQTDEAPVCRVANRAEAWLGAIRERLADRDALRAEGERLREWVHARYFLEDWPDDWLSALTPGSTSTPAAAASARIFIRDPAEDIQGGWQPEVHDGLPRILAYAQTTRIHDYRGASPLRALGDAGLAHTMLVGKPNSSVVSYLPSSEVERLAPTSTYWHLIIDDLRLEGLRRCARDFPDLLRVYSIDDRVGDLPPTHPQAAVFSGGLLDGRVREALRDCQRLVVTTQPLAELYGSLVESVHVVPNRLETAIWREIAPPPRTTTRRRPRVGWAGAQQHHGDLALIAPVVAELADEVDWVFLGMMPPGCERHVREFHAPVNFRDYPAKLASLDLDIAVAPLEINPFNEAKSNLRLLDYGWLGWPVVCTDILPYRIDKPPVMRVTNTTAAWTEAIRALAADPEAARRRGEALRQWVYAGYLLEDGIGDWLRALT